MTIEHLLYVCDLQGRATEWIRILPLGRVELRDSRKPFEVKASDLEDIIKKFRSDQVDLVVDYQHQSLGDGEAPAAGWIQDLEARADGLYSRVKWTAKALQQISNNEFRYYSPVIKLTRPMELKHAALTNTPALKGTALSPLLAAKFGGGDAGATGEAEIMILAENSPAGTPAPQQHKEATAMLKQLIAKLGLQPEATAAEVLAQVESREQEAVALKAQAAALPEISLALGLKAEATVSEIKGTVLALKQGESHLSKIQAEVAALKAENAVTKGTAAVEEALKAGKLQPTQTEWALEYAGRDLEGFKVFVEKAPKVVPVGDNLRVLNNGGDGADGLSAAELAMCKQTGVAPEAFMATKKNLALGQA